MDARGTVTANGGCYSVVLGGIVSTTHPHHLRPWKGFSHVDVSITQTDHGDRTVVHLGGDIDVYTAPIVRESLDKQIREGRTRLVLDLAGVNFLDSTGLGVLVGRLKLVRSRGGDLRLAALPERVRKVFTITGLDKVFQIHADVEEAIEAAAGTDDSEAESASRQA